jgi:hypothetical protein
MKRATVPFPILVLLLSLSLVSCDSMFQTNLFAKLTHPTPSMADISSKTPAEMQTYVSSTENMNQLADDPALKAAALANLESVYSGGATTVDQQTAAIVAAEISIQTVPDAAGLSASAQAALAGGIALSDSPSDISSLIKAALPKDIKDSVSTGAAMPSTFAAVIDAYLQADAAYTALGTGVGADGGYAAGLGISSSEKADVAVNALIAGLISAVQPTSGSRAEALWAALTGGTNTFTVASGTIDEMTTGTGPIANLVNQSSLISSSIN